jgi:hypothetical protein
MLGDLESLFIAIVYKFSLIITTKYKLQTVDCLIPKFMSRSKVALDKTIQIISNTTQYF